jgi:hypothetical protein
MEKRTKQTVSGMQKRKRSLERWLSNNIEKRPKNKPGKRKGKKIESVRTNEQPLMKKRQQLRCKLERNFLDSVVVRRPWLVHPLKGDRSVGKKGETESRRRQRRNFQGAKTSCRD